jgi:hypothetical protein
VIIASLTVNDRFGGLVFYQDKGRTTSSDHRKKLKKLLMLMSAIVSLLTIAADYSLGQVITIADIKTIENSGAYLGNISQDLLLTCRAVLSCL